MNSRIEDLSNTSNSIANINTNGFKSSRMNFQELLDDETRSGSKTSNTQLMTTQGNLITTGASTDLAINGDGYFSIKLPDGTLGYTRDGNFHLDENNKLVTSDGYSVVIQGTLPTDATDISVDQNGKIFSVVNNISVQSGSIQISRFTNPSGLSRIGDNIYIESLNSGKVHTGTPGSTNFGSIVSGSLESSNVDLANEMTHMIVIQRSFQLASKAFETTTEMIDGAIHLRKV